MYQDYINKLLTNYPLVTDQVTKDEIRLILNTLSLILTYVPGAIVELGCHEGTTSLFISRLIKHIDPTRQFHVYDSFTGLPDKTIEDNSPIGEAFKAGELSVSKKKFIENYTRTNLTPPIIHKSWFKDLTDTDIPDEIAFAFLDGDFYSSIKESFRLIENKINKGSMIIVDDYQTESLPGVKRAVDEWSRSKNLSLRIEKSLAIISIR